MDEMKENQEQLYTPRPAWQVWCARVALVLVILFMIYQILSIATGGM